MRKQKALHTAKVEDNVIGRVNIAHQSTLSSFMVSFQDGDEYLSAKGRADDSSDKSIVSAPVAENAVLSGKG